MNYIIIGYGNIGHKRKDAIGKKCIATVDPNPNSKADYKDASQIPKSVIKKCDSVIITVPRHEKNKAVEYWLKKNKNVLVEKPFIITKSEGEKLLNIARKNKVIWYTGYNYHFEPHIIRIKQLLDKGFLGKLYRAHFIYGFGNVRQLIGTWREVGSGALEEISPHLIDFTHFLLGYNMNEIKALSLRKVESKTYDHCVLTTKDLKVLLESSWIMWKNAFVIEIFGEKGSIHMNGLCKWGDSELIVRKRILPAGLPEEKRFVIKNTSGSDPTWKADIRYFEKMAKDKKSSFKSDLKISDALIKILRDYSSISEKEAYYLLRGK